MNGAKDVIPTSTVDEMRTYKDKGYLIAGERDGITLDFANFGNSPFNFTKEQVNGRTIVYSTTNGTNAIFLGKEAKGVAIGSFLNLNAVASYLIKQQSNILILCAAWKGKFCLEDTLFAGALVSLLQASCKIGSDSAYAALDLWGIAEHDPIAYIQKAAQRERLRKKKLDDVIDYSFTLNQTSIVPVLDEKHLIPV